MLDAFAQEVCRLIGEEASDEEVLSYIRATYRLVLLHAAETAALNRSRLPVPPVRAFTDVPVLPRLRNPPLTEEEAEKAKPDPSAKVR